MYACFCLLRLRAQNSAIFFSLESSWIRQCDSGELIHQCVVSLFLFSNPYFCVVKILYVKLLAVKCSSFVCSYVCVYQNLISSLLYYVMCYILCVFHSPIVMFFSRTRFFSFAWLCHYVTIELSCNYQKLCQITRARRRLAFGGHLRKKSIRIRDVATC